MKKIIWGWIVLLLSLSNFVFAGAFSVGIYGNIEGRYEDDSDQSKILTNVNWASRWMHSYYEMKLAGRNLAGFDIWSKIGVNATFIENNKSFLTNYTSSFFQSKGILPGLQYNDDNNFEIKQWEAHIQKIIKYKKGQAYMALFRGEDRTDIGQPYLRFTQGQGNGETKAGFYVDANGIAGFSIRGFLMDYQSQTFDNASEGNKFEFSSGFRIFRPIISKPLVNFKIGITGGFSQYYKRYIQQDIASTIDATNYNRMFYNVVGFDSTLNGTLPKIMNYYVFFSMGRSYAPEKNLLSATTLPSVFGDTNSVQYVGEIKLDRKLEFGGIDFGTLFLGYYVRGREGNNYLFLNSNGDGDFPYKFDERLSFTYNFPVKMVILNGNLEYYHNYNNFDMSKYHLWSVGNIVDKSVTFKQNLALNIMFKGGYSFNVKWNKDSGNNYLGKFLPEGVHFLTFSLAGESKLGKLSPQMQFSALGDPEKQVISTGIELFLNLSSWLRFYSRTAYVVSKGYWKSETGNLSWWNAYLRLEMLTGDNSKLALEFGEGGHTSDGFVADVDLIKNGKDFEKKVYMKFEYWM